MLFAVVILCGTHLGFVNPRPPIRTDPAPLASSANQHCFALVMDCCTACNCCLDGSHNSTCDKTTGQCPCKEHSVGRTCDKCPSDYYGLGSPHPQGCLHCQCSNKTNNCTTAEGWVETVSSTKLLTTSDNTNKDGWKVVNGNGLTVKSLWDWTAGLAKTLSSSLLMGYIRTKVTQEMYFSAPAKYVSEGRFAYTYTMSFKLQQDDDSSPENSTKGDVILKGKGFNQPIVYRLPSPPGTTFTGYTVQFIESDWYVGTTQGRRPSSSEMVAVLSTLQSIRIRAKWTTFTDKQTRIADINMKFSKNGSSGKKAFNVETCICPKQYVGQFCERCAPGYTRATPNVCSGCQHNTTGNQCEDCADGLYGNASHGTANDCKPCPCPGGPSSTNQFSPTCILDSNGRPTCNNCTKGHKGRSCEECTDGYYGTPTIPIMILANRFHNAESGKSVKRGKRKVVTTTAIVEADSSDTDTFHSPDWVPSKCQLAQLGAIQVPASRQPAKWRTTLSKRQRERANVLRAQEMTDLVTVQDLEKVMSSKQAVVCRKHLLELYKLNKKDTSSGPEAVPDRRDDGVHDQRSLTNEGPWYDHLHGGDRYYNLASEEAASSATVTAELSQILRQQPGKREDLKDMQEEEDEEEEDEEEEDEEEEDEEEEDEEDDEEEEKEEDVDVKKVKTEIDD
ncbi:hypothetical protein QZH41_020367, partial [Actinostola sp. cb2023]